MKRIMRWKEMSKLVPLSRMHVWRLEQAEQFPRRVKLSTTGTAVGWYEDEVMEWLNTRPRA